MTRSRGNAKTPGLVAHPEVKKQRAPTGEFAAPKGSVPTGGRCG
jgi:hypothetical protein